MTERLPIEAQRQPLGPRPVGRGDGERPHSSRLGRRLLGTALLVSSTGLASCHGFAMAIFG